MFLQRSIYPRLREHLPKRQITVLTGMRRTGKTTLLKQLMADSGVDQQFYFDLERLDTRALFSEPNYETVIHALQQRGADFSRPVLLALDEIQLVPTLPSLLKYLYDHYPIKFLVTGSAMYYIKNLFSESLAGRKKIFEVYPLHFGELLDFVGVRAAAVGLAEAGRFSASEYARLKPYYEDYIRFGGFPEVVLSPTLADKQDLLNDILSSYINFDIALLADIRRPLDLYKLVRLLSARIGTKLDISRLTSEVGLSRPTVENYLGLLEKSYLIRSLPVLAKSPDREIVKARKVYFLDNGLAALSGGLSSGACFENAVFNQLLHHGELAYYQRKTGHEIDFVLGGHSAYEAKETGMVADVSKIRHLSQQVGIPAGYVVARHVSQPFEGLVWGGFIRGGVGDEFKV